MLTYKNLTIIGTSHISPKSVKEVKTLIENLKPNIVAVELDQNRFMALMSNKKKTKTDFKKMLKVLGIKGFLFNVIGAWAENKLGKIVGVKPGTEMKTAIITAMQIRTQIALIDRDISITIKNLFKYLTWKEKFRFVKDLLTGLILKKDVINFDLRNVPEQKFIKNILNIVKKRYPSIYRALVKERDKYMAKNLYNLMQKFNTIVAVVGAGHEKGIIHNIKQLEK